MILKSDSLKRGAGPCKYKTLSKSKYQCLIRGAKKTHWYSLKSQAANLNMTLENNFKLFFQALKYNFL